MTPEELRVVKNREYLDRKACRKDRIDMTKIRATELPGSKDMKMPGPVTMREELKIQLRSQSHLDAVALYICEKCDEKGTISDSDNLSHKVQAGMEEIREGILKKGWMIYTISSGWRLDKKRCKLYYDKLGAAEDREISDTVRTAKIL